MNIGQKLVELFHKVVTDSQARDDAMKLAADLVRIIAGAVNLTPTTDAAPAGSGLPPLSPIPGGNGPK